MLSHKSKIEFTRNKPYLRASVSGNFSHNKLIVTEKLDDNSIGKLFLNRITSSSREKSIKEVHSSKLLSYLIQ